MDALGLDPEVFEAALLVSVAELGKAYPERFESLIAEGDGHTFIMRDFDRVVGGVPVRDWISAMLAEQESWESVAD